MPVIHAITIYRADGVDTPPFTTSEALKQSGLREGERGTEIVPECAPMPDEYVVRKIKYSAFYLTDLELLLRSLGVTYVVVAGLTTNFCVRSTVHDACFRDYMAIVPRDCTMSYTDEEHEQSLRDIANGFGQVSDADTIIDTLRASKAKQPA